MAEEDETRFERLERSHQETREWISEMMEMIRALVREKGQAAAPNPQNGIAQPEQRREDPVYPQGSAPLYAQMQPMPQMRGFQYGYASPPIQTHEVGQNSGVNTADPITIPDLNDPKKQEKLRKGSLEQSESNEANENLSSLNSD